MKLLNSVSKNEDIWCRLILLYMLWEMDSREIFILILWSTNLHCQNIYNELRLFTGQIQTQNLKKKHSKYMNIFL